MSPLPVHAAPAASSSSNYAAAVTADGPSVYYRFQETSGTLAADGSGNGRQGTYQPGVTLGVSGAITSDTSDLAIRSPGGPAVVASGVGLPAGNSSRSLEIWFTTNGCCVGGNLVRYGDVAGGHGFGLSLTAGITSETLQVTGDAGSSYATTLSPAVADGRWHLLAATYDGSTAMLYVDGQVQGSGPVVANTLTSGGGLDVGGAGGAALDEAALYPAALSASKLDHHWSVGHGPGGAVCAAQPTTPYGRIVIGDGPAAYYRLNDVSDGRVAYDSSGHCANAAYEEVSNGGMGGAILSDPVDGSAQGAANAFNRPMLVANSADLPSGSAPRTLEIWFNNNGCCTSTDLITYGDVVGGHGFALSLVGGITSETLQVTGDAGSRYSTGLTPAVADGNWHQLAASYDGTTTTVYVDGQLQGSGPIVAHTVTPGQGMTVVNNNGSRYDSAAVYSRALTPAQVDAHWSGARSPSGIVCAPRPSDAYGSAVTADGPSVLYRLNDFSPARVAYDSSGNCANGAYEMAQAASGGAIVSDTGNASIRGTPSAFNSGAVTGSGANLPAGSSSRTLAIWFNNPGCCLSTDLIRYGDVVGGHGFDLALRAGITTETIEVTGDGGNGIGVTLPSPAEGTNVADGNWHLLTAAFDGKTVRVFLDGRLEGGGAVTANTVVPGQGLVIGSGAGLYNGAAIYAKALDPSQLTTYYSASGRWQDCNVFAVQACWADVNQLSSNVSDAFTGFIRSNLAPGRNPDFVVLTLSGAAGYGRDAKSASLSAILTCSGDLFIEPDVGLWGISGGIPLGKPILSTLNMSVIGGIGYVGSPADPVGSRTNYQIDGFVNNFPSLPTLNLGAGFVNGMQFIYSPAAPGPNVGIEYWKGAALQDGLSASYAVYVAGPHPPSDSQSRIANQSCGDIMQSDTWKALAHVVSSLTITAGSPAGAPVAAGSTVDVVGSGYSPNANVTVTLHSAPVYLATVRTDGTGAFDATVTIPSRTPAGPHTIETNGPAAGSSGALKLTSQIDVATSSSLTLTPPAATNPVGGKHTVTATVKSASAPPSPVSGQKVDFTVTGQNAGASGTCSPATCITDASGSVTFTYTDIHGAGDDTIMASFTGAGVVQQATAVKHWVTAPDPAINTKGITSSATEGQPFSGQLVSLTDPDSKSTVTEYSATVDWGDGTPSTSGTLSGSSGSFSVSGSHIYSEEGTFKVAVTIQDTDEPGNKATGYSTATVADAALTGKGGLHLTIPTLTFVGSTATFADTASPSGTLSDFSATIDYGDGSVPQAGTVSGPNGGPYAVSGSHTYKKNGTFTVRTMIKDSGGRTAAASDTLAVGKVEQICAKDRRDFARDSRDLTTDQTEMTKLVKDMAEDRLEFRADPGARQDLLADAKEESPLAKEIEEEKRRLATDQRNLERDGCTES